MNRLTASTCSKPSYITTLTVHQIRKQSAVGELTWPKSAEARYMKFFFKNFVLFEHKNDQTWHFGEFGKIKGKIEFSGNLIISWLLICRLFTDIT